MKNRSRNIVVDADGHVMEPADTWTNYIDPQFRNRAIRIDHDEKGYEVLLVDNSPLELVRGHMGVLGGIGMDPVALHENGKLTYAQGCPLGGYDPKARLKVMDQEKIDISILYPTIGICWEGMVADEAKRQAAVACVEAEDMREREQDIQKLIEQRARARVKAVEKVLIN